MNKNMPSFVDYIKDVFTVNSFFDTIYDRSKDGLKVKSQKEIYDLYNLFRGKRLKPAVSEHITGSSRADFADGVVHLVEGGEVLPYTRNLFRKYGVGNNERNKINGKGMAEYISAAASDKYFDVNKIVVQQEPIKNIATGTATFKKERQ